MHNFTFMEEAIRQAQHLEEFRAKCRVLGIDPEPLEVAAKEKLRRSWDPYFTLKRALQLEYEKAIER